MFPKSIVFIALLAAVSANLSKPHRGYAIPLLDNRLKTAQEAADGEFPWQVSLQWGWYSGYSHFCSGAIVNASWIVTAGQCGLSVPSCGDFIIKAGAFNLKENSPHEQIVHADKIIIHPNYTGDVGSNDIALIKLEKPLVLNAFAQNINFHRPVGLLGPVTLAGWGSTSRTSAPIIVNRLQKTVVHLINKDECKNAIENITGVTISPLDTQFCSKSLDNGFPPYISDTGSPLIVSGPTIESTLLGIVSWGILPTGTSGAPLIYTNIKQYIDWIDNIIATN